jgi:excinuclease UvrABC helicase subunit UvrB
MNFKLRSNYQPRGDQPAAIEQLTRGVDGGEKHQVLLGVTGSGKTFTVAKLISNHFSRKTPSNISSATTIFISRRRTFPQLIFISTRKRPSTMSSTSSA